jgi:HK97 family phage major capsid protein
MTRGFESAALAAINVAPVQHFVALGAQRLTIMDLIAPGTTGAGAVPYPRENGYGTINGVPVTPGTSPRAGAVGEGGLKPTWEPDLTTETATVKKIAITTKIPSEFMEDFPVLKSYIDNRLPDMVDRECEAQILYGDGIGINIRGIASTPGIQTRAVDTTSDTTVVASLKKGITDISVNAQFEPTGFAFNPYDWETATLLKDSQGRYLAGGPFYIPYGDGTYIEQYTLFGKPVVVTSAVTYGKPLLGAWKLGSQFFTRSGVSIEATNSNEDDFRRGLTCLRCEERGALAVYRPVAFLEFTNFPARQG